MDLPRGATGDEIQPGAVIAGRYKAERRVGAGGMGAVWSGEHLAVGVKVALKQLLVAAAENHEVVARFRREAVFLGKIRSDHVARVLDFVTDDKYGLILVMEYIEGDPLSKILGARTLSVEETIDLGADIAAALVDLHRHSIIHRDLKPGNIIWQVLPNNTHRAVIVDFGVSRILEKNVAEDEEMTGITRADMALGTIEYMAPEQILNSRDVTPASDIYALGAILFRAHAGKHVFGEVYDADLAKKKIWTDPPPLQTGRTDKLSRGLEAVVNRALTRSPKKRYAQADEVLAELNMLRDLIKAASFDIDTMTTRDNSAIIEAISAAEKKSQSVAQPIAAQAQPPAQASPALTGTQPISAKDPTSGRDSAPAGTPPSSPVQSAGSIGAATASIPGEPRVVRKGVSTAIAIVGILVVGVGGVVLGTRLGPNGGGLLPGAGSQPSTNPAVSAPATVTLAPSGSQTGTGAAAVSADSTAVPAPATAAPTATADASATATSTADKPKLHGKLPDAHPTGTQATAAATSDVAPTAATATSAPTTAAVATAKPAVTPSQKAAPSPSKDPAFTP